MKGAPFFEGKTISMWVTSGVGGGLDFYSRTTAKHIPKYIPGKPTVIVRNVPGGRGLLAFNKALRGRRDGTHWIVHSPGIYVLQLVGDPAVKFDLTKMPALGAASWQQSGLFIRKDRFATWEDVLAAKKPVIIASTNSVANSLIMPNLLEAALGRDIFKVVTAYRSGRDFAHAVISGEADGSAATLNSILVAYLKEQWEAGELIVPVITGAKPRKEIPDAVLMRDLATTPERRALVIAAELGATFGRPFMLPSGVPRDRVKLLRDAFWQMMHDKEWVAQIKRAGRLVRPMRGEELEELWKVALQGGPAVKEFYKKLLAVN